MDQVETSDATTSAATASSPTSSLSELAQGSSATTDQTSASTAWMETIDPAHTSGSASSISDATVVLTPTETDSGTLAVTTDTAESSSATNHGPNSTTSASEASNTATSEASNTATSALNVCNETVPEELHVDGIPAYAQCPDSQSVAIWSNDGVNTSSTQQGDWRRTQWDGGYQCTEFANRYLFFVWGVERVPNGNAGTWCDEEPPEGLVQSAVPVHGDLIVFAPGSCGASEETGHVAVVDTVNDDASRVIIVEQNRAGRRTTDVECAACFLHAEANDGS